MRIDRLRADDAVGDLTVASPTARQAVMSLLAQSQPFAYPKKDSAMCKKDATGPMISGEIQHWIDATQSNDEQDRPPKGRRFNELKAPASMASPSDETPGAKRGRLASDPASYSDHLSISSSSSSAQSASRSSPLKHMRRLWHDSRGPDIRELAKFRCEPPEQDTFLNRVAEFAYGHSVCVDKGDARQHGSFG